MKSLSFSSEKSYLPSKLHVPKKRPNQRQWIEEIFSSFHGAGINVAKATSIYRERKKGTAKALPNRTTKLRIQGLRVHEISKALVVCPRTVFRYLEEASK